MAVSAVWERYGVTHGAHHRGTDLLRFRELREELKPEGKVGSSEVKEPGNLHGSEEKHFRQKEQRMHVPRALWGLREGQDSCRIARMHSKEK